MRILPTSNTTKPPRRPRLLLGGPGPALISLVKIIGGSIVTLMILTTSLMATEIHDQQTRIDNWSASNDYAVLYPLWFGDDDYGPGSAIFVAWPEAERDLYPLLDAHGALYIDASTETKPCLQENSCPASRDSQSTSTTSRSTPSSTTPGNRSPPTPTPKTGSLPSPRNTDTANKKY